MKRGFRFAAAILVPLTAMAVSCARKTSAAGDPAASKTSAPAPAAPSSAEPKPGPSASAAASPERSPPIDRPSVVMRSVAKETAPAAAAVRPDTAIPSYGEAVRLPRDYAVGQLGSGGVHAEAYQAALAFCRDLAAGKLGPDAFQVDGAAAAATLAAEIAVLGATVEPRVGGPATPNPDSVAYLVRFIGSASARSGEIQLRKDDAGRWLVDALTLDYPEEAVFDPLAYKRFL
jgi:hypothetical protein